MVSQEEYDRLLVAIDSFTSEIFDHVTHLGRVDFLHTVYDFRHVVEKKLEELNAASK